MGVIAEPFAKDNSGFRDCKLILLDGSEIDCFLKPDQPECFKDDALKLDTSNRYFSMTGRQPKQTSDMKGETAGDSKTDKTKAEERKAAEKEAARRQFEIEHLFFLDHAYFFLKNADRILTDSRMFLAPVAASNGLAYTGTSGFQNPTLGIYIEWWLNCKGSVRDPMGRKALTHRIAGSPLSGCNHCGCIYPDGHTESVQYMDFRSLWSSFMNINKRYTAAKQQCESYTLQQVYDILAAANESEEQGLNLRLRIQEQEYAKLTDRFHSLKQRFRDFAIRLHSKELADFKSELVRREDEIKSVFAANKQECENLRLQFKQRQLSQPDYCRRLNRLTDMEKKMESDYYDFKYTELDRLMESGDLTEADVYHYLYSK